MGGGALEADDALCLLVAVGQLVGVVADVGLGAVGQAALARGLVGPAVGALGQVLKISSLGNELKVLNFKLKSSTFQVQRFKTSS